MNDWFFKTLGFILAIIGLALLGVLIYIGLSFLGRAGKKISFWIRQHKGQK